MRLRIKIFLIGLAAFLVVAHLLLWVFISNRGPALLQKSLSFHLGYTLSAERVKFSFLSQGIHIKNLQLHDPRMKDAMPFFTAKKVLLRLNLFALLLKRISVRKLLIVSPTLSIARDRQGNLVFPSRISKKKRLEGHRRASSIDTAVLPQSSKKEASHKPFFAYKFHKIEIRKGEILFSDDTASPPFWVRLKNIQARGRYVRDTRIRFAISGQVESREPATFEVGGEINALQDKYDTDITLQVHGMDITLLAPYYQPYLPAVLSGGKLSLHSKILCDKENLKDASQTLSVRNLKIHSWRPDFLQGAIFGIPKRDLVRYLEQKSEKISLDFSISGPLKELKTLSSKEIWEMLGVSAVHQWIGKDKSKQ